MSICEKVVEELEADVRLRKRFAELLVTEPDIRLAIINAIMRDVATKEDMEKLRVAMKEDMEKLRIATKEDIARLETVTKEDMEKLRTAMKEDISRLETRISGLETRINSLDSRVSRLEGQMSLLIKLFIAFNIPILVGIIGILLK